MDLPDTRWCRVAIGILLLSMLGTSCSDSQPTTGDTGQGDSDLADGPRDASRPPDRDVQGDGDPVDCESDADCYDENPCTWDYCDAGWCANVPSDTTVPSQIVGNCQRELCEGGFLVLVEDNEDLPPSDGIACTTARCEQGNPRIDVNHANCADTDRCNGAEYCDPERGCQPGTPLDQDHDGIADSVDPTPPDMDGDGIADCADWETCDGLDNDNNGLVDDSPIDEEIERWCYEGPDGTEGVGTCRAGLVGCERGGLKCLGQVIPAELEYCDGLDNDCDGVVPEQEAQDQCRAEVTFTAEDTGPQLVRMEFPIALRSVDVHFNIDTTASMFGALNQLRTSLRTEIVPAVAEVIPVAAFGVSTFEDFPLNTFGAEGDLPFELWQRVTTRVDLVQEALSRIDLGSGLDFEESGIESLYQLASGAGLHWPRPGGSTLPDPSTRQGFMAEIDPAGDVDFYVVSASGGDTLQVDVEASRIGSSIDLVAVLYDSTGFQVATNDDFDGIDPALDLTLDRSSEFYLEIRGYSTYTRGWYFVEVLHNGLAVVPAEDTCSALEVGGDFFDREGEAIELQPIASVTPRSNPTACAADCTATLETPTGVLGWITSFCSGEVTANCGNREVEAGEECDDGNRRDGDGCSASCRLEMEGVAPFDGQVGFDPNLGHGTRGGAGFREQALPIIVHATDAPSHVQQDYLEEDPGIGAHDTDDMFYELEKLGARIVGITTNQFNSAPVDRYDTTPGMACRTGSLVPPCAFEGSAARLDGRCGPEQCCVGLNGNGRSPPGGTGGLCALSFEMDDYGRGLSDGVVAGINALADFATYSITPVVSDDPRNPADARCFLQYIEVHQVIQATPCAPEPELADRDEDGTMETVVNATPRSRVTYDFWVENRDSLDLDGDLDAFEPCGPPGSYYLQVEITGDDVAQLGHQELRFIIAP